MDAQRGSDLPTRSVRIDEACAEVLKDFIALAERRNIQLECDLEEEAVKSDEVALQTLLRNLVSNAKTCTSDAGLIRIATTREERNPLLSVEGSDIGIPCSEREHVLRRLYRGAGQAGTGVGLGLAIVARIADAQRTTMSLRDSCFGGLRVEMRFEPMT